MLSIIKSILSSVFDFRRLSFKILFSNIRDDLLFFIISFMIYYLALDKGNLAVHKLGGYGCIACLLFLFQDLILLFLKWWCDFYRKKTVKLLEKDSEK